jgi:hypothetical protein
MFMWAAVNQDDYQAIDFFVHLRYLLHSAGKRLNAR